jgi:hypothetical protein
VRLRSGTIVLAAAFPKVTAVVLPKRKEGDLAHRLVLALTKQKVPFAAGFFDGVEGSGADEEFEECGFDFVESESEGSEPKGKVVDPSANSFFNPTDKDLSDLYYVVEYLRGTQETGHILHQCSLHTLRLYCEVDASYLLHPDSKGHTGYTISFQGTQGTFHNRSVKQTAVATSSTHAEARAIFTLAKDLNFIIALCQELRIPLELPAIIMEDNSAVVTMANNDSGYTKKCKHFLMVLHYVKEQIALGQIEARKIFGKLNNADLHTKPLRSSDFQNMALKILGQPSPPSKYTPTSTIAPTTEIVSPVDMGITSEPVRATKRGCTDEHEVSSAAKRRRAHLLRFISSPTPGSTIDAMPHKL